METKERERERERETNFEDSTKRKSPDVSRNPAFFRCGKKQGLKSRGKF
jgi:hypothetical protein